MSVGLLAITDLSLLALKESVVRLGLKPFNAIQILEWLYQKKVSSFEEMTNISKPSIKVLKEKFSLSSTRVADLQTASDGTALFLFELKDGKKVEAVFIPNPKRNTICLSTQVGCAMACEFCRTGQMDLMRNLSVGEILEQVLSIQKCFPEQEMTNIVFMGMGEPMANLPNLIAALEILTHTHGFGFAKRRITVSTAGLVPKMYDFIDQSSVKLAISLHAPNEALRTKLMPINLRYPLKDLIQFCREYKKRSRFRITFEYVMLKNTNDSIKLADELIVLLEGIPSKINLIPFNPFPTSDFISSTPETVQKWCDHLMQAGIQTNVRANRGRDILAACGQLAA